MVKCKAVSKTKGDNILKDGRQETDQDPPRYGFFPLGLTFCFILHGRNESRPNLNDSCYQNPQVICSGKLAFESYVGTVPV